MAAVGAAMPREVGPSDDGRRIMGKPGQLRNLGKPSCILLMMQQQQSSESWLHDWLLGLGFRSRSLLQLSDKQLHIDCEIPANNG